jgi:hypothetical protein
MNPKKPAPTSAAQPSKLPAPERRFLLQKLEERIAPKGTPFSKRWCRTF